jgi:hypothetical protein
MANLDTRSKRASSVNFWKPYVCALVLPDGTINQGDRQHTAWTYSGLLAAAAGGTVSGIFHSNVFLSRVMRGVAG